MKTRWISIVLALVLMLSACPLCGVSAASAWDFEQLQGYYKTQGRVYLNDTALEMDTTSSGFEFYFEGSGDVTLQSTVRCSYSDDLYLTVIVDGVRTRVCVDTNQKGSTISYTVPVASGLAQGLHHIEVYKQSEAIVSQFRANTVTFTGTPVSTPPLDALTMEVVGDSISSGASMWSAATHLDSIPADYPYYLDGTKTYAYLAGEAIGANVRVTQASGYGCVDGFNTDGMNLQKLYPYTNYWRSNSNLYAFDPPADIVVINLGTNDGMSNKVTDAQFKTGSMNLMQLVREKNPGSKVVWCTGMMGTFFPTVLQQAVAELGGAENGFFFCELPYGVDGGYGHPNVAQHEAAANVLKQFLLNHCLPAGYADTLTTQAQLTAALNTATAVTSPSEALKAAIMWAQAELNWGTTDPCRLGVRLEQLRQAMTGESAFSLMPRQYIATCPMESNGSYIWPYYAADGSVTLYKGGEGYYWPHIETLQDAVTVNVTQMPYLRIQAEGTAYFNLWLTYKDASGTIRTVTASQLAGNGDADFAPGIHDLTLDLGSYLKQKGHADENGYVPLISCDLYSSGDQDVYTKLTTCAIISNEAPAFMQGDVNGDGEITTSDARMAMLHALGGMELTGQALMLADYNGDGDVSTTDARLMIMAALAD